MFARRVFELMSSNTLVVSNYSRGMEELFGELAVFADRDPTRLKSLSDIEVDALREQALTKVLREHTYAKRWQQILNAIGMPHSEVDERFTVVCIVRNRGDAVGAITWFQKNGRQLPGSKLLLVIGTEVPDLDVAKLYQEFNRFGIGVTSISHATKYALDGSYRPVETPYFVLIDPKTSLQRVWLEKAQLHLQYMSKHLIAPAASPDVSYRLAAPRAGQPLVGVAALFNECLKYVAVANNVYYV
jgi:hypothetical protein